jgi:hypothetical protein
MDKNTRAIVAVLIALLTSFYQLPGAIAIYRNHKDAFAINAWNFGLGWTIIGWFVTLFWSLNDNTTPAGIEILPPPSWNPDPKGEADLRWWNGAAWTNETKNLVKEEEE